MLPFDIVSRPWHSAYLWWIFPSPRGVFTFEIAEVLRRSEHLCLLKARFSKVSQEWKYQRAQFVTLSIVVPVFHEGFAVQQLEEDFTHFPHNDGRRSSAWQHPAPVSRRPYLTWGELYSRPSHKGLLPLNVGEKRNV